LVGRHPLRAGLVQHALIAAQLACPQVAGRLATLTTRKLFGHGVRNPLSLVISDFNHESILRLRAGHWRARAASKGDAILAEWLLERWHSALSLDKTLIEARPTEALSRPRHFVAGHTYSRHFDTWMPINLETPPRPERGVVNRVVEAVAVDANNTYHPPRARACQAACFRARSRFVFVTL
jgi:hypothetical protein